MHKGSAPDCRTYQVVYEKRKTDSLLVADPLFVQAEQYKVIPSRSRGETSPLMGFLHKKKSRYETAPRKKNSTLSVLVDRSHATRANVIVGFKSLDFAVCLMKIRAESTFCVAVAVTYIVAAYFTFSANCAYFTHDIPPKGCFWTYLNTIPLFAKLCK